MTNPSQQNKEILEKFRELWGNYPRTKNENSLGLDYLVEQLLLSALEQKDQEKEKALIEQEEELRKKIIKSIQGQPCSEEHCILKKRIIKILETY